LADERQSREGPSPCPKLPDRNLVSFSSWPLVQPFYELLQHEKERQSDRDASRPRSAKMSLTLAFEMGDLACVSMGGREGDVFWSLMYFLY
jgi:hypothetical protein